MPWCKSCDRFLSPSTVRTDGTCPNCGARVEAGGAHAAENDDEQFPPLPWHLKLLAAATAIYLGFRAWQGIAWLVGRL